MDRSKQKKSCDMLKCCLLDFEILGYYWLDVGKIQLVIEVSNVGFGVVKFQVYRGEMRVICYVSCKLFLVECNYLMIENEILVVVWVCKKFFSYLYGVEKFFMKKNFD